MKSKVKRYCQEITSSLFVPVFLSPPPAAVFPPSRSFPIDVQRKGEIRLQVIEHADNSTLQKFIHDNTAPDTEAMYTDELPAYWGIEDADTRYEWVNHSREEMGSQRRSHQRHRERLELC